MLFVGLLASHLPCGLLVVLLDRPRLDSCIEQSEKRGLFVQVRGWERMDASVYLQGKVKFERLKSVVSESFVVSCYGFLDEAVIGS
jgi:hypothetical protein